MSCRIPTAAPSSGIRTAACRRGCRQLRGSRRLCLVVFSLRQRGVDVNQVEEIRGELARLGHPVAEAHLLEEFDLDEVAQ